MKSEFRKLIVAFAILGTMAAAQPLTGNVVRAQRAAAPSPVHLGVLLTMTGAGSYYGKDQLDAVKMAVNQVNKTGGIRGHKVLLDTEDTRSENTGAVTALNKILESNPAAIVGPVYGTEMLAMQPILDREGVPTITISGTRSVTQQGSKNIFRTDIHDGILKVAVTNYILNKLHLKKIGLLVTTDAWGTSGQTVVSEVLANHGLKPVDVETYDPTATAMTAQLQKLKTAGAQVIVTQGYTPDQAIVLNETHDLGLNIPIFVSTDGLLAAELSITSPASVNGIYAGGLVLPETSKVKTVKAWTARFKKQFHYTPNLYAAVQYDGISALLAVMQKYGISRDAIRSGMHHIRYKGLNGIFHSDGQGNMLSTCHIYRFNSKKIPLLLQSVTVPKSQQK